MFAEHQPETRNHRPDYADISEGDLYRLIRADATNVYAYVIVLTGNISKEEFIEGMGSKPDDSLTNLRRWGSC